MKYINGCNCKMCNAERGKDPDFRVPWCVNNITVGELEKILIKYPCDSKVDIGSYRNIAKLVIDGNIVILSEDGQLEFDDWTI